MFRPSSQSDQATYDSFSAVTAAMRGLLEDGVSGDVVAMSTLHAALDLIAATASDAAFVEYRRSLPAGMLQALDQHRLLHHPPQRDH